MNIEALGTTIVSGPAGDPDITWVSLRRHHGRLDPVAELARVRADCAGPLFVEPFSSADLAAITAQADGVIVGAASMQDFQLLRMVARTNRPVVVQRAPAATLEEWLSAAEYCVAEGNSEIILCETGSRTHLPHATLDLTLVREAKERSGRPVLVEVSAMPELSIAALAAGADGLMLAEDTGPEVVASVRRQVVVSQSLENMCATETIAQARAAIDRVDAALATLLERRAELAGRVQRLKPVGGFAGRDPGREREIVEAMVKRAPSLGTERLARIMNAVIETGLEAAEAS
jgi:3-deoxy-D-arabino-heptulosonate 7-phosphate (DAHP) synthase